MNVWISISFSLKERRRQSRFFYRKKGCFAGFHEKTGLKVYARSRINFGDEGIFVTGITADHYSEDDLYDDRYGYESRELGAMVSRLLPYSMTLRLGYDFAAKDYRQPALDLEGNTFQGEPSRSDTYEQFRVRAEKTFRLSDDGNRLNLFGEYQHIRNDSNDAYYDYHASSAILGVELVF
jgi:hypothetical protein